jgi:hypothetical protein
MEDLIFIVQIFKYVQFANLRIFGYGNFFLQN